MTARPAITRFQDLLDVDPSGLADGLAFRWNAATSKFKALSGGGIPASVGVLPSGDATGATDAANLQAAINSLRGVGGTVGVRGKYTLSSGLTIFPGIGLAGDGPLSQGSLQTPSWLQATAALNAPIITAKIDPGTPTWVSFPYLRNLAISGTHAQTHQHGVALDDTNGALLDVFADHLLIFDVGGSGWYNVTDATIGTAVSSAKVWLDGGYLERCQGNGIRTAAGTWRVVNHYIQNNVLFGIDATSSDSLSALGNMIWQNAGGGVMLWSMTSGIDLSHNYFSNNGDNTHPAIVLKSISSAIKRARIVGNEVIDSRASGSAAQFLIQALFGVQATIIGNTLTGQKAGNPAISVTANAGDDLLIRSNPGFNPVGQITNPLDVANNRSGLGGSTAVPVASTDYVIAHVDQYVVATGGANVAIAIKDNLGNVIQSGLATFAGMLPIGWKINFGAFTVAPAVASYGN